MNSNVLNALNAIQIDPRQPANITYAKARYAIEEAATCRKERRAAKLGVVELLGGSVNHITIPAKIKGQAPMVKKEVVFPDQTKARF